MELFILLFIAAGAFHASNPSDLLPELQGRLPIRVELEALSERDFFKILTQTNCNLIQQQKALFGSEGVDLEFSDDAIKELAPMSKKLNESVDNIDARRLRAVISKLIEQISFDAPDMRGQTIILLIRNLFLKNWRILLNLKIFQNIFYNIT